MFRPYHAAMCVICLTLVACKPAVSELSSPPLAGADVDAKGCLPSAGYQWSALATRCVRAFEVGQRLSPTAQNPDATLSAFVHVDIAQPDQVEVFWASEPPMLLTRVGSSAAWTDGQGTELRREGDLWLLARKGTLWFSGPVVTE